MPIPSNMIPLGSKAPDFTLIDTRSKTLVSLKECQSPVATVVMFLSNHCPYVKHIQPKLVELANRYIKSQVQFVAISSNDVSQYPEDGPEQMAQVAEQCQYPFPYLYDESQEIAKVYKAACTPDFYIFDKDLLCVYRGCMDESTPGNNKPVTGEHLAGALDAILAGNAVAGVQKPSLGCGIKWKS